MDTNRKTRTIEVAGDYPYLVEVLGAFKCVMDYRFFRFRADAEVFAKSIEQK